MNYTEQRIPQEQRLHPTPTSLYNTLSFGFLLDVRCIFRVVTVKELFLFFFFFWSQEGNKRNHPHRKEVNVRISCSASKTDTKRISRLLPKFCQILDLISVKIHQEDNSYHMFRGWGKLKGVSCCWDYAIPPPLTLIPTHSHAHPCDIFDRISGWVKTFCLLTRAHGWYNSFQSFELWVVCFAAGAVQVQRIEK